MIKQKIANLINVKTLVTFAVVGVFCVLALRGEVDTGVVMAIG